MMAVHGRQVAEQERQAAILKERARLARDVHDTLAQGFTGVILQMEAAEEALFDENPDAAVQRVRRARQRGRAYPYRCPPHRPCHLGRPHEQTEL